MLSQDMQNILFENGSKFAIEPNNKAENISKAEEETRKRIALTINRNINSLGYSLDSAGIQALATYDIDSQKQYLNDIIGSIQYHTGEKKFNQTQLFYPNFPEEVMGKDEFELYLNAIVYYTGENLFGINAHQVLEDMGAVEKPKERTPLIEVFERKPKTIISCKENEIHNLMEDHVYGNSLSEAKTNELFTYAKEYPDQFKDLILKDKPFNSHEIFSKIVIHLYETDQTDVLKGRNGLVRDANDVLRVAALMSNKHIEEKNGPRRNSYPLNDANLSVPAKRMIIRLNTQEKRFITGLLDQCPNLYTAIWEKEDKWKKAMPYLGLDKASERVNHAFDNLARKNKVNERGEVITTPGKALESIKEILAKDTFEKDDKENIENFVKKYPKLFIQNVVPLVTRNCHTETQAKFLCDQVKNTIGHVEVAQYLTAMNYAKESKDWDLQVFRVHSGHLHAEETKSIPEHPKKMMEKVQNMLADSLLDAAKGAVKATDDLGKVYIDSDLANNKIPTRGERNASGGAVLTQGSSIKSEEERNLIAMAIWWKNKEKDVPIDIDLSAVFLDENYHRIDHLYYGHSVSSVRETSGHVTTFAVHSGDFTDGNALRDDKGVEEMVVVDKALAKEIGAKYVTFYVNGYSGDFNKAEDLRCVLMEKEGTLADEDTISNITVGRHGNSNRSHVVFCGKPIEPTQIDQALRLNAPSNEETPCYFNLDTNEYVWLDAPYDISYRICNINDIESQRQGILEIVRAENNAVPTMEQLLSVYAGENGVITNDITEADTIYLSKPTDREELGLKENAEMVTAYDLGKIAAIALTGVNKTAERAVEKTVEETVEKAEENTISANELAGIEELKRVAPKSLAEKLDEVTEKIEKTAPEVSSLNNERKNSRVGLDQMTKIDNIEKALNLIQDEIQELKAAQKDLDKDTVKDSQGRDLRDDDDPMLH